MTVADLAREMARRYVDMLPIAERANALLVFLRVPLATRQPAHVAELGAILRRVREPWSTSRPPSWRRWPGSLRRRRAAPSRASPPRSRPRSRGHKRPRSSRGPTVGAPIEPQASTGEATS